jgi:adenine-specific DNA-methyltransferase
MLRISTPDSCNVYTPPRLADAIVAALGTKGNLRWLEPCVGKGAFLLALRKKGVKRDCIVGLDIARSRERADSLAMVTRSAEFLTWSATTPSRFDRIIANPPFVALSKLPPLIQSAASAHSSPDGEAIALSSNCWYAFLCASLRLLSTGGSLAFVLPASYEYADYAARIRRLLPRLFGTFEVHRCRVPLFDSVGEGSVVVIGRDYGSVPLRAIREQYDTVNDLIVGLRSVARKSANRPIAPIAKSAYLVRLTDVMAIRIGAVTGDADFFLLTETDRVRLGLPLSALKKVVSRSRHVQSSAIHSVDWQSMRERNERVWLFRPTAASLNNTFVNEYLADGGCNRQAYKVRQRDPWYITPLPVAPHGFLSGMSQNGPTICFNQMHALTASNTLYTVRFSRRIRRDQRVGWALMLLTTAVSSQLYERRREYALGLVKYEPGDLGSLMLPSPRECVGIESAYRRATDARLAGECAVACAIADRYVRLT